MAGKRRKKQKTRKHMAGPFLLVVAVIGMLFVVLSLMPRDKRAPSLEEEASTVPAASDPADRETLPSGETSGNGRSDRPAALRGTDRKEGMIAIIIDDAGNDIESLKPFLAIRAPLTFAVLPKLPLSEKVSELITASGKEVMLHLPLEPVGDENPGPGVIRVSFSREEMRQVFEEDLATVPHAQGVNNHMGSLATQDKRTMDALFGFFKEKNLYFIDSKTIAVTVCHEFARIHGVPMLERTIFLDVDDSVESMRAAFAKGAVEAEKNGFSVMIGHVQNNRLAAVIDKACAELSAEGFRFVAASELMRNRKVENE